MVELRRICFSTGYCLLSTLFCQTNATLTRGRRASIRLFSRGTFRIGARVQTQNGDRLADGGDEAGEEAARRGRGAAGGRRAFPRVGAAQAPGRGGLRRRARARASRARKGGGRLLLRPRRGGGRRRALPIPARRRGLSLPRPRVPLPARR